MNPVVFSVDLEVRWRDLDAFNHVNNASYLGYIEEARVRWFKSLSSDWAGETSAPVMVRMRRATASFPPSSWSCPTPAISSSATSRRWPSKARFPR